eukprot:7164887-Pyramimonas_sp.AAC.1
MIDVDRRGATSVNGGYVYVDGSARSVRVSELRSAGWAVTVYDADKRRVARYDGAAPRREGPSQVARDGEDYAIMKASELVMGPYQVKSDCKGSV